ncbi:YqhA family protein [Mucisphaera calidilacus]|uniref:YqhA family protein n=1 Tax=Mucisphaera calidilacus TaxID=2527982 RepID=A0A518BVT4_9BACT|nr:YqhA family protein [Mucisphaera calidilacus]QDU71092.1 hypothetical protein Pan265_09390 [Mucisphaera calidilacus]
MVLIRAFSLISIITSLVGSALMVVVGCYRALKAILIFAGQAQLHGDIPDHIDHTEQTVIAILESIDAFLISLALLVFAVGVYKLLINTKTWFDNTNLTWLRIDSLEDLKRTLIETIMVILAVLFTKQAFTKATYEWTDLVIPVAICLFAVALRLLKWTHSDNQKAA